MNKNSKIYIAGHEGMLGASLIRILRDKGYSNITFRPKSELDLRNQAAVENFFEKEKPEYVFLTAARVGGIQANNTYTGEFIYDNLQIQNNVIHTSWKSGVSKLLFVSCSCAYPKESPQPMKEDYLLTGPLEPTNEPFAIAKIAGIKMCDAYNKQYNTDFRAVVTASLFGPGDNFNPEDSHFVPALIRKFSEAVKKGQDKVYLWGTGKPRRELMYVDDAAKACIFLMNHTEPFNLMNIGIGDDISIREVAELLKEITNFKGALEFDTTKPDGMMRKLIESSKIADLGWKPEADFKKSLELTYKYFQEQVL